MTMTIEEMRTLQARLVEAVGRHPHVSLEWTENKDLPKDQRSETAGGKYAVWRLQWVPDEGVYERRLEFASDDQRIAAERAIEECSIKLL